ncbi:CHAT domain-containing protein [candidate division KSB1 bacterium]|nr:CHAT domain-containing protein [candidate division KSB1 bacterium]
MRKLTYEDFEIRIRRAEEKATITGRDYPVEAKSTQGEAEGRLKLPFSHQEMNSLRNECHLLDEDSLSDYGKKLYDALFDSNIKSLFETSFRLANSKKKGLRVKLRIQSPEIAVLPWEILKRSDVEYFLAQSEQFPVVRYIDLPYPNEPLTIEDKLQILIVSSNPLDQQRLDLTREKQQIHNALLPLQEKVEFHFFEGMSKLAFTSQLRHHEYHIIHFMGHGGFDAAIGQGFLLLEDDEGMSTKLSESDLRLLLVDCPSTRVVVFTACDTAKSSSDKIFSGVATSVTQAGVPAVVSMQFPITDEAANHFSKELYLCLSEGYGIDQAVAQARKAIKLNATEGNEWITPALYMRSTSGYLFESKKRKLEADISQVAFPTSNSIPTEFVLHVRPLQGDEYLVEVTESPAGTARSSFILPQIDPFLNNMRRRAVNADRLKSFGRTLFDTLFTNNIVQLYNDSIAQVGNGGLRIRLISETSDLDIVPWECLCDSQRDSYLTASGATRPFRRQVPARIEPLSYSMKLPLRILLISCGPLDLPLLDLDREWHWLQSSLRNFDTRKVQIDRLIDPTPSQVLEKLQEKEYHIFHFSGHDTYAISEEKGEGIVLMGNDGEKRSVVKDELIQLLQGFSSIRLVVTNTCYTANQLAPSLVRSGIPSAIGIRYWIEDEPAIFFTKLFYSFLLQSGLRIDTALAETRRELYIQTQQEYPIDWCYPTLYTCVPGDEFFSSAFQSKQPQTPLKMI